MHDELGVCFNCGLKGYFNFKNTDIRTCPKCKEISLYKEDNDYKECDEILQKRLEEERIEEIESLLRENPWFFRDI